MSHSTPSECPHLSCVPFSYLFFSPSPLSLLPDLLSTRADPPTVALLALFIHNTGAPPPRSAGPLLRRLLMRNVDPLGLPFPLPLTSFPPARHRLRLRLLPHHWRFFCVFPLVVNWAPLFPPESPLENVYSQNWILELNYSGANFLSFPHISAVVRHRLYVIHSAIHSRPSTFETRCSAIRWSKALPPPAHHPHSPLSRCWARWRLSSSENISAKLIWARSFSPPSLPDEDRELESRRTDMIHSRLPPDFFFFPSLAQQSQRVRFSSGWR